MAKPLLIRYYRIMERHFIAALVLALTLPLLPAWAQAPAEPKDPLLLPTAEEEESVFAPFPTRIRVGTHEDGIVLTWEDGADGVEGYAVYRSEKPIDRGSFPHAERVATLPKTAREYRDAPTEPTPFYYAVLGLTAEGAAYEVFIPLKNVTLAPVAYTSAKPSEPAKPAEKVAPKIEVPLAVSAESFKDGIRISWTGAREGRRINVYRSVSAIRSLTDLLNASWVAAVTGPADGLTDYPVPGIDYYYALVDDEELRDGDPVLEKGKNATTEPVSIPAGLYRVGLPQIPAASRSLPLPFLSLTREVGAGGGDLPRGFSVPSPRPLQPDTEKVLASILAYGTPKADVSRELTIFPGDHDGSASGGEEYTLRLIVSQRLAARDWAGASDELARYLSLNRSPAVAARAHFYRGQALAFSGSYRDAFFEFLLAQDTYYAESNNWIDWLLDRLPSEKEGGRP